MAVYVGVLTMFAGEDKRIVNSPPASVEDPPDISDWTIEYRFTWTDGSGSFTISGADVTIENPDYSTTIPRAQTVDSAGKRLYFQSRRTDPGEETELDWGYINILT